MGIDIYEESPLTARVKLVRDNDFVKLIAVDNAGRKIAALLRIGEKGVYRYELAKQSIDRNGYTFDAPFDENGRLVVETHEDL